MKKLTLIIWLTLVSGFAFSQWIQLNPELTNPQYQLNSVFFTDVNTGYAVGRYRLEDYGTKGFIIKTIDGGAKWDTLWWDKTTENSSSLTSVFFTNAITGYAVGGYHIGEEWNLFGIVLKTNDGGLNWDTFSFNGWGLNSVYFTDAKTGYVVGSNENDGKGIILKTIDGGITWTQLSSDITQSLYSIFFIDINTGYAIGWNGTIIKTINGGATWESLSSGIAYTLHSVFFINSNTGYVVSWGSNERSANVDFYWPNLQIFMKTEDGGATWSSNINQGYPLRSVFFTDSITGYAVGDGGIIKTTDGGLNWISQTSVTSNSLLSVYFTDSNTGYAVGNNGTILKTTNGGGFPTFVENVSQESTFTVYPNPATNKINIETHGNLLGETTICIFNMNGAILQLEKFQSQTLIEMDVSAMVKGIYLLQIQTKAGVETEKLVVQ